MFSSDQPDWRLILGIGASALLHVGAAAALAWRAESEAAQKRDRAAAMPEEIRPGIRQSRATTITWIGYEEPTPQQAEQSPVDQAAQTKSSALASPPPVTAQDDSLVPPPSQPSPEQAAQPTDATPTNERAETDDQAVTQAPARETAPERVAQRRDSQLERTAQETPEQERPERTSGAPRESTDSPKAPRAPETAERDPAPETEQAEPGEPSDRESPAASKEKPIEIELGKPAAREGIYIETVRPRWTHFTTLTARPENPLVEVAFNSKGRVVFAEFVESSGARAVDGPLLDAIYNWTARGEKIEALRPDTEEREGERAVMQFRIGLRS